MLVTLFGMVTKVKPVQLLKALLPIFTTLFGISILLNLLILLHKSSGITSTESPKTKFSTWFPKFHPLEFFAFHTTDVMLLQSSKALSPMLVTLFGMVTEVKPLQPRKAYSPMLVTLLGIVTEVKLRQPEKADSPMLVTLP